jgi:predicted ABC-type ATPase
MIASPVLYVIAGPNGIGKTTSNFDLIPKNIPLINSDEIAKEVKQTDLIKVNAQEFSNREAIKMMNEYLEKRASFAIETNLADIDTWKFLLEVQKSGFRLEIIYISTSDIDVLNSRIDERFLRGEHYVRPDIVRERYVNGLNLLNHYFDKPNKLQLVDNSVRMILIAEIEAGKIIQVNKPLPSWIETYLGKHFEAKSPEQIRITDMDTVEEVRKKYLDSIKKKNISKPADDKN